MDARFWLREDLQLRLVYFRDGFGVGLKENTLSLSQASD
jgi:hypothetical protein